MKTNKKIWVSLFLAFTMVLTTVGCTKAKPVAIINGEELSEPLYRAYLYGIKMQMEQGFGPGIWELEIEGENMESIAKERALESAVAMSVTSKKAKEMKLELTSEEKAEAAQIAEDYVEQFKEDLDKENITVSVMKEMMQKILLSQKVLEELSNTFSPSDNPEELNKFIEDNKAYFEEVKAQHVLINTIDENGNPLPEEAAKEAEAKAKEVLAKALAGEDMGALAKEYSQDPGSKDNNGEYTFPRGQMVPEFEEVAFGNDAGVVHSELVKTAYGYHIIKTVEKIEANEEDMKNAFEEGQKAEYVNGEIDEWIKSAEVEKTDLYDAIVINQPKEEKAEEDSNKQEEVKEDTEDKPEEDVKEEQKEEKTN